MELVSKKGDLVVESKGGSKGRGSESLVSVISLNGKVNLEGKNINIEGAKINANEDVNIVSSEGNTVIGGVRNSFNNSVQQNRLNEYNSKKIAIENQIKAISTQF